MSDEEDRLKAQAQAKAVLESRQNSGLAQGVKLGPSAESTMGKIILGAGDWAQRKFGQSEQQKLMNDIAVAKARAAVDAKAIPAAMWVEHNVPGFGGKGGVAQMNRGDASFIPGAADIDYRARGGTVATDMGDVDEPPGRQPVQMSREFPSTAQGKADEAAYIEKVREAARKASAK